MPDWLVGLTGVIVGALISLVSPILVPHVNRWERKRIRQEHQLIQSWKEVFDCSSKVRDLAYLRLEPETTVKEWSETEECHDEFDSAMWFINDPHPVKLPDKNLNEAWRKYRIVAAEVCNTVLVDNRIPDERLRETLDRAQAKLGEKAFEKLGAYHPDAFAGPPTSPG